MSRMDVASTQWRAKWTSLPENKRTDGRINERASRKVANPADREREWNVRRGCSLGGREKQLSRASERPYLLVSRRTLDEAHALCESPWAVARNLPHNYLYADWLALIRQPAFFIPKFVVRYTFSQPVSQSSKTNNHASFNYLTGRTKQMGGGGKRTRGLTWFRLRGPDDTTLWLAAVNSDRYRVHVNRSKHLCQLFAPLFQNRYHAHSIPIVFLPFFFS